MIKKVRYFSQWESPERVDEFLQDSSLAVTDEHWRSSGAQTAQVYAEWASHLCGCACIKMAIYFLRNIEISNFEIRDKMIDNGGYVVSQDGIKGLIYTPAVQYLNSEWHIQAKLHKVLSIGEMVEILDSGKMFIASVNPEVRDLTPSFMGSKGGHLVLCYHHERKTDLIEFHNPSGWPHKSQSGAKLSVHDFERYFGNRGISLTTTSTAI